jgi:hypothetical protein
VSALFLSGHSQDATQARGHEVGGPRGVWAVTNHMNLVGFPGRRLPTVNTPNVFGSHSARRAHEVLHLTVQHTTHAPTASLLYFKNQIEVVKN